MEKEYYTKEEILRTLSLGKAKWMELKGQDFDVTHEDFINDVIFAYSFAMRDIEKM